MHYLPHTDLDRESMLEAIGIQTLDELFNNLPEHLLNPELNLPSPQTETEIQESMQVIADKNKTVKASDSFLGAGSYRHFRPSTVDTILQRGEFYTSYTPYQPEISQGMLQALFEYQSMICQLVDMEVCNASHYDGATSLAEAVLLALNVTEGHREKVILSPNIHPQYKEVVDTYLKSTDAFIVGDSKKNIPISSLTSLLDKDTAALVIQNPNYFGQFEDVRNLAEIVHDYGALLICIVDPIALGLFQPPGEYGADIVVADGQCLGLPVNFGGPNLGIFATKKKYVRQLAGRIVGETVDTLGKRGYVMTLATREQHIRRERATSNICTNAALSALGAAVYLATLGKSGLKKVAKLCYQKSHYAANLISDITGFEVNPFAPKSPFFKEFIVRLPKPVHEVNQMLLQDFGIIGGYDLEKDDPRFRNLMMIAVTELNTKESIDRLIRGLKCA